MCILSVPTCFFFFCATYRHIKKKKDFTFVSIHEANLAVLALRILSEIKNAGAAINHTSNLILHRGTMLYMKQRIP